METKVYDFPHESNLPDSDEPGLDFSTVEAVASIRQYAEKNAISFESAFVELSTEAEAKSQSYIYGPIREQEALDSSSIMDAIALRLEISKLAQELGLPYEEAMLELYRRRKLAREQGQSALVARNTAGGA